MSVLVLPFSFLVAVVALVAVVVVVVVVVLVFVVLDRRLSRDSSACNWDDNVSLLIMKTVSSIYRFRSGTGVAYMTVNNIAHATTPSSLMILADPKR